MSITAQDCESDLFAGHGAPFSRYRRGFKVVYSTSAFSRGKYPNPLGYPTIPQLRRVTAAGLKKHLLPLLVASLRRRGSMSRAPFTHRACPAPPRL